MAFCPIRLHHHAGLDPTGLTVADVNGDGKPDLLIGNPFGDVLVLAGKGDGTFRPLLARPARPWRWPWPIYGNGTKDIIYANQGLDSVVVDYGGGQRPSLGDRSTGLLAPGAVTVADLNGDGIPDLIVANSGSNNVLVYPGLGNGQFGPALNGGHGFFTGTNPVGITVADVNGNGRPDLVVANRGSNDVSILLNQATGNGGFTFVPGPRLNLRRLPAGPGVHGRPGRDRRRHARRPGQQQPVEQCHGCCRASAAASSTTRTPRSSPWATAPAPCSSATSTANPAC